MTPAGRRQKQEAPKRKARLSHRAKPSQKSNSPEVLSTFLGVGGPGSASSTSGKNQERGKWKADVKVKGVDVDAEGGIQDPV